jgi:hypothetical protein
MTDPGPRLATGLESIEEHAFVFRRSPQPLDEDVVHPAATAVHRDSNAGVSQGVGEGEAGELRALAVSYFQSAMFAGLQSSTRSVYRNIAEAFCREHGDKRAALLRREHIERLMASRSERPDSANGLLKVLRAMMKHAIKIGIRGDDPTAGIAPLQPKSKPGFHRWTEPQIAQFKAHYRIGSRARLALTLGLYTAQARQDVIAMGPQHIRDEVLNWVRKKTEHTTAMELAIPIHPDLREIIDATPSGHLTFLVTELGKPFTALGLETGFATSVIGQSCHTVHSTACVKQQHQDSPRRARRLHRTRAPIQRRHPTCGSSRLAQPPGRYRARIALNLRMR